MNFGGNDKNAKKLRKRIRLALNVEKGKLSEAFYVMGASASGKKVERTGKGHDFKVTSTNYLTGRKRSEYVEIKSSRKAPLSKLQKEKKNKMQSRYKVIRPLY